VKERVFHPLRAAAIRLFPESVKMSLRHRIADVLDGDSIITYGELSARDDVRRWDFGDSGTCRFDEPEYYNEIPREIAKLLGTHEYHQPFVLEVPNVELVGQQGIKITDDGRYIVFNFDRETDYSARIDFATDVVDAFSYGTWPFATPRYPRSPPEIDTAIPLLHRWARNYSHWTEEWLTQFEGLRHYCERTGTQPTIIVPPDPPSFVPESLAVLGYCEDDYIEWDYERLRVRRLVLPSIRRFRSDTSDDYVRMPSGLRWLRDTILENVELPAPGAYPSKLFISREDADVRRIVNRDEVESTLAKRGFETVVLSELPFVDQKRLFYHADTVVGTHGAGLTELLYAPNAAVLELFGSYMVPVYLEMAKGLDMPYGCLKCETAGDNIVVDIDELLVALDTLAVAPQSADADR
jgi:hypothetical protein